MRPMFLYQIGPPVLINKRVITFNLSINTVYILKTLSPLQAYAAITKTLIYSCRDSWSEQRLVVN